jgi:mono/diheme cytochrome c family protein
MRTNATLRGLAAGTAALALAGCTLQLQNRQASETLAREAAPPGSVYTGWRVYQERCARCHGADATGNAVHPNLLLSLRETGPRRFVGLVLRRYDWNLPAGQAQAEDATREVLVDQVLARREPALQMPAWGGEPEVSGHVMDLYAYLAARAEGTQGPGRPAVR